MGLRLKQRRKLEDTIVGQVTNSVAIKKVRNNMPIQMNRMQHKKSSFIQNKSYALFSARKESGIFEES